MSKKRRADMSEEAKAREVALVEGAMTGGTVTDRAADLAYEFGAQMPGSRFINVDNTPENALIMVKPAEMNALLRVAIEVGMEIEREG